jgi:hypothetical protein
MRHKMPVRIWKTFVSFVKSFAPPRPTGGFWDYVFVSLIWLLVLNPVFWALMFGLRGIFMLFEWFRDRGPAPSPLLREPYVMPSSWMLVRVSVQEAEEAESCYPDDPWIDGLPFGFCNRHWCRVKEILRDDDQLWKFCSPADTWENFQGRAGYAVVRGEMVVAQVVTMLN